MLLDGLTGRFSLPSVLVTVPFAFRCWIRATGMGESNVGRLYEHGGNPTIQFNGSAGSNKIRFRWFWTGTDGNWDMTPALTLGAWHHLLVYYAGAPSSAVPVFYLDGALVGTTTINQSTSSIETNTYNPTFGGEFGGNSCLPGDLSAVAWWQGRVITADEAALIYHYGPMASPAGLYSFHRADYKIGTVVRDYSGNGRDATLSGTTTDGEPAPEPCFMDGMAVAA